MPRRALFRIGPIFSRQTKVSPPQIYSWDSANYKMKHGIEVEAGCIGNTISNVIIDADHCVDAPFGGAGLLDGTNQCRDTSPRSPADYELRQTIGNAVPDGFHFLSTVGTRTIPGFGGAMLGRAGYLAAIDIAVSDAPTSAPFSYQAFVGATPVGAPFTIDAGKFAGSSGWLAAPVNRFDEVTVRVAIPAGTTGVAGAPRADHRAVLRFY